MTATPNHALQRTAPRVTVAADSGLGVFVRATGFVLRPYASSSLHFRSYRATLRRR